MSELPNGWAWLQLKEFASLEHNAITDGPFGSNLKTADYVEDGEVRVIRLGNLGVGEFTNKDRSFVSAEKFASLTKHEVLPGDLVVAALAEPVGRCVEVPPNLGLAMVKADCVRVRVNPIFDRRYLMHALNSPDGKRRAEAAAHGMGRLRINLGDLRSLRVPTAPPAEQRRIVDKLEALQARTRRAREALDAVPPLLETLRQSILAAAFRGDLTKDWRAQHPNVEPATELLKRIRKERRAAWERAELAKLTAKGKRPTDDKWKAKYKEPDPVDTTDLPELPAGWCWASLAELLAEGLVNGRSVPTDDAGFPVLRLTALKRGQIDLAERKGGAWTAAEAAPFLIRKDDFLVSRGNGSLNLVGRGGLVEEEPGGIAFPDTLIRIRVHGFVARAYLAQVWTSRLVRAQIERAAKTTAGIFKVSQGDLENVAVPVPSVAEQLQVAALVNTFIEVLRRLEAVVRTEQEHSTSLERTILAKAFRGELVPQDPNDEPAEEMLVRVRVEEAAAPPRNGNSRRKAMTTNT